MFKYFIATIVLLVGVGFLITAGVIKQQVGVGRSRIAQAEQNVDTVKRLSNLSEYTAPAGDIISSYAEGEIRAGRSKADHYQSMSNWFLTLGIILTALSALAFLYFWKKS